MEKKCAFCGDIIKNSDKYFTLTKLDKYFKPIKQEPLCMNCYKILNDNEKTDYCFGKIGIVVPPGLSGKELADFIMENL